MFHKYSKIIPAFLAVVVLTGCKLEPVTFERITNVSILGSEGDFINMDADAILFNPNSASGQVQSIELDVYFKDNQIAEIEELSKVKVPANGEFKVPLRLKLNKQKIQSNWLETLAGIISSRSLDLHFKGHIKLKIHGFRRNIPVDYVHSVTL